MSQCVFGPDSKAANDSNVLILSNKPDDFKLFILIPCKLFTSQSLFCSTHGLREKSTAEARNLAEAGKKENNALFKNRQNATNET